MIHLELPFPPAVNNITAVFRGRKITSKRGREYRKQAVKAICDQMFGDAGINERLAVTITLYPPCRRKRDIDNYSKACLDAITAAGVWTDDELVDRLTITRAGRRQGGACIVTIEPIDQQNAQPATP